MALWNNPTKSAEIKAYLDSGDVELFGMVYDPALNAAYHKDIDGDRIGDSIDNCISIANPDQELAPGYTDCGAACVSAVAGSAA